MRKFFLTKLVIAVIILSAYSSQAQTQSIDTSHNTKYSYAYISVEGKLFTKKLKVIVDFGDTPVQINKGVEYSNYLTNKKSYAAVLNYMVEQNFELVNTLDLNMTMSGSGGTSGIIFIMKKKE